MGHLFQLCKTFYLEYIKHSETSFACYFEDLGMGRYLYFKMGAIVTTSFHKFEILLYQALYNMICEFFAGPAPRKKTRARCLTLLSDQ